MNGPNNVTPLASPVDKELVTLLQELLDDAKSGKIVGIGIATVARGAEVGRCVYHLSLSATGTSLIGAVTMLQHRLCQITWNNAP